MRKHVIEYDNVLNNERNVVYTRRRAALIKGAISEGIEVPFAKEYGVDINEGLEVEIQEMIEDFIQEIVERGTSSTNVIEDWDHEYIKEMLTTTMMLDYNIQDINVRTSDDLADYLIIKAKDKYKQKEKVVPTELLSLIGKIGIVTKVGDNWQEHLREDEELRNSVSLLAHAQKDPLIAYKQKSFESFKEMLFKINHEALEFIFKARVEMKVDKEEQKLREREKRALSSMKIKNNNQTKEPNHTVINNGPKIKRNDPCPCGSGKKYKNCCGMNE